MNNKPIKVLLIEDDAEIARSIRAIMSKEVHPRFDFECANRLSAGLEYLNAGGIDVILLDLFLPDSQGLDTFTRVQAQAPETPIVILTGLNDEDTAVQALQAGDQDYLVKGDVKNMQKRYSPSENVEPLLC